MSNNYLSQYPPSYSYSEVMEKINKGGGVAYCYSGSKSGTILLHDSEGRLMSMSSEGMFNNYDSTKIDSHELWSLMDEMDENSIFRQTAMNTLIYLHCNFYNYLKDSGITLFKRRI